MVAAAALVAPVGALTEVASAAGSRRNFCIAYHMRFGWSASNQLWGCMRCRVQSRSRLIRVCVETRTDEMDDGGSQGQPEEELAAVVKVDEERTESAMAAADAATWAATAVVLTTPPQVEAVLAGRKQAA